MSIKRLRVYLNCHLHATPPQLKRRPMAIRPPLFPWPNFHLLGSFATHWVSPPRFASFGPLNKERIQGRMITWTFIKRLKKYDSNYTFIEVHNGPWVMRRNKMKIHCKKNFLLNANIRINQLALFWYSEWFIDFVHTEWSNMWWLSSMHFWESGTNHNLFLS